MSTLTVHKSYSLRRCCLDHWIVPVVQMIYDFRFIFCCLTLFIYLFIQPFVTRGSIQVETLCTVQAHNDCFLSCISERN